MNKLTNELANLLYSAICSDLDIEKGTEITIKFKSSPQIKRLSIDDFFEEIQIETGNDKIPLNPLKEEKKQKKIKEVATEQDKLTASRLLEIKQAKQKMVRKANLELWAIDVMSLKKIEFEGHLMNDHEIEQAFIYAFQVNPFWSDNGIIISPKTLLEHMKRVRKPTFREAFINWLDKGGKLNDAHRSSDKKDVRQHDPVREGFRMLGIELSGSDGK